MLKNVYRITAEIDNGYGLENINDEKFLYGNFCPATTSYEFHTFERFVDFIENDYPLEHWHKNKYFSRSYNEYYLGYRLTERVVTRRKFKPVKIVIHTEVANVTTEWMIKNLSSEDFMDYLRTRRVEIAFEEMCKTY